MSRSVLFPATGPAFIRVMEVDDAVVEGDVSWLVGSSTGALRATALHFGRSTGFIARAYLAMVWYPWRGPGALREMMRRLVRRAALSESPPATTRAKLAIMVTHSPYLPSFVLLFVCLVGNWVGVRLIYRLAELHVYVTSRPDDFPLAFDADVTVRFKALTSRNLASVLYASVNLPLLMGGGLFDADCDGGLMFYFMNGRVKAGADVVLVGDAPAHQMTRALCDPRPIHRGPGLRVVSPRSANPISLLDWFNPLYVMRPHLRVRKWLGHDASAR